MRPRFARRAISPKTTRDTRGHSRSRPAPHVVASMSLLRRPNDHHRDLRARLPAKKPPHTGSASDQDRYLMTLSPLTDNRRHSCGHLVAANAQARRGPLDRPAVAPQMLPELPSVPSPPRVHPTSTLIRSPQAPDPSHSRITPRSNPHSVHRTAGARPIAISRLGAFWTPADRARGCHCIHRHPKTCTLAVMPPSAQPRG